MTVHNALTGAELHETKGASGASQGHVLVASGAATAVYQALLGNVVHVNALADLPPAVAGKITLLANTVYLFGASVNIGADYLLFSNGSSIQCLAAFTATVTYVGTVPMCQGNNASVRIKDINLLCSNSDVYGWSDGTPGTSIVIITDVLVIACQAVGVFDEINTLVIDGSTVVSCTTGIAYTGTITGTRLSSVNFISTSVTFIGIDFTGATLINVNIGGMQMSGGAGSIGIKGDAGSANITANHIGHVSEVQFQSVTTPLSGITTDDIRWNFQSNGNLQDTMTDAMVSLTANATTTVLSVGVPTLVSGTFVDERSSHFTVSAGGRLTYIGERNAVMPINAVLTLSPDSGTGKTIRAFIAVNGTEIVASGKAIQIDTGDPLEITLLWQLNFSKDDYIELFIENETDSIDVTVDAAILRAR